MDRQFTWGDYDEDGLRFALLTAYHKLRDLAFDIRGRRVYTFPQRILGGFVEACADMEGAIECASESEMDRAPSEGEWPLRAVIEHTIQAEHGFRLACERALISAQKAEQPSPLTQTDWPAFRGLFRPEGGTAAVVDALRRSRDLVLADFAGLPDAALDVPAYYWESAPLPLRFRLMRFELHLRQHTIQADKTMAGIGRSPSEAERLTRLVRCGFGDVEASLLGAPSEFETPGAPAIVRDFERYTSELRAAAV